MMEKKFVDIVLLIFIQRGYVMLGLIHDNNFMFQIAVVIITIFIRHSFFARIIRG